MATQISAVEAGSFELPTATLLDVQTSAAFSAHEVERRVRHAAYVEAYEAGLRFDRLSLLATTEAARADFAPSRNQAFARAARLFKSLRRERVQ